MKAVVFDRFGDPEQVLQTRELPEPRPGPGQVRVRMLASPVNPSDLLSIRGLYGKPPPLPTTPGFEGVGVVEESGGGLLGWLVKGRRVAVLNSSGGNWQEQVVIPARQAVPVPNDLPDEQVASFFVNPASALLMTDDVLQVPPGAWLLQTAAGSALGRMVIRLGKHRGFRTINVVRRREQVVELKKEGADEVLCSTDESIPERVQGITGGQGVPYVLDAVGGTTGATVAQTMGRGGRMLVYGALAMEPMPLDPRVLIMGQKKIEGFWLSEWARQHGPLTMLMLFRRIGQLMRQGILTSPVGPSFSLDQVQEAVHQAAIPGRQGKVLLRMTK